MNNLNFQDIKPTWRLTRGRNPDVGWTIVVKSSELYETSKLEDHDHMMLDLVNHFGHSRLPVTISLQSF